MVREKPLKYISSKKNIENKAKHTCTIFIQPFLHFSVCSVLWFWIGIVVCFGRSLPIRGSISRNTRVRTKQLFQSDSEILVSDAVDYHVNQAVDQRQEFSVGSVNSFWDKTYTIVRYKKNKCLKNMSARNISMLETAIQVNIKLFFQKWQTNCTSLS